MNQNGPVGPIQIQSESAEPLPWRQLSRREVYRNPWITVVEDVAEMPNGRATQYGIVQCAGAVGVLPFVDDDHVLLVQQWRYIIERNTWEMPTGGMHRGESLAQAAQRELSEEAGVRAGRLIELNSFNTSKSVVDETATLFLAHDLEPCAAAPDDTEFIRRQVFRFDDVVAMVIAGEIVDSMTVVAVLLADRQRRWPAPLESFGSGASRSPMVGPSLL